MGYINRLIQQDRTGWQAALHLASFRLRKMGAGIRWLLYRWGLPVLQPDVFYAAGWNEYPAKTLVVQNGQFEAAGRQIIEWLTETVLHSPVVIGLDIQLVKLTVLDEDGKVLDEQSRLVDKYGWRKEVQASMETWLGETMARMGERQIILIGAAAQSFGNMALVAKKELQGHR